MPHLIIEYSSNLDSAGRSSGRPAAISPAEVVVEALHRAALDSPLVPAAGLRTRAEPRSLYRVADGDPVNAFVAITARLGPGRSAEQKTEFLQLLLDTAEHTVSEVAPDLVVSYSVEIQEIDADFRINRNHIRARMEEKSNGR